MYKRVISILLAFTIFVSTFFSYSLSVYASKFVAHDIVEAVEYGIKFNDWEPFYDFLYSTSDGLMYLYSQMGAFIKKDFITWVDNNQKLESLANTVPARKEGDNIVFTKELMTQLKALLDEYVKTEQTKEENGGFYLIPTMKFTEVSANNFTNIYSYQTFRYTVIEKGALIYNIRSLSFVDLFSDPSHPKQLYFSYPSTPDTYLSSPSGLVHVSFICAYDWESEMKLHPMMEFEENDKVYKSCSEAVKNKRLTNPYIDGFNVNGFYDSKWCLYSTTGERVRVFVSQNAAKNYSVGKRKIFVTNNYYDYEPEDLSVTIDDLTKGISDLQDIIDELMRRITDDTTEREIMELLRLILEEMRNQHSTGGGGGSGGDVTVNVDLSTTNNLLSKIYNKVSQISDRISSFAGQSMSEVVENIENLQEMLKKYLKEITGDLDDIKGQLEEMSEQEFSDKTESFLDDTLDSFSEISEKAKGKFPFSIPNDIRLLITKMSVSPPADQGQGTYSMQAMSYDADHESNGLISVMDEGGGNVPVISETGAPIFYIPFVIASAGIDQYVVIDLSGFESISSFCRSLMTIFFILCLFNLTFKVMGLWGDLVD